MIKRAQPGYTIIETMLFIAISSALLVFAVMTMNSRITEVRYFDGVSQVEAFLQKQLSEVTRGVRLGNETVTECTGDVGASNCTTLGRLISIESTDPIRFSVEEVYGVVDAPTPPNLSELQVLKAYTPELKTVSQTYEEATGLSLTHNTFQNPDSSDDRAAIFILRSPRSGAIEHFTYTVKPDAASSALFYDGGNAQLNETVNLCLEDNSSSRISFITIGAYPASSNTVNDTGYLSLTRDASQTPGKGGC